MLLTQSPVNLRETGRVMSAEQCGFRI